ncbi:hypothetical protein [Penaeicola halotolerans]|uniref:hypothetical protein n=1 Tax=Penaeicola halotolerans TaxID=2793196 RepID=UPI001CF8B91C|nr:hypothetical protein [Penaeicola halotolerans]
MGSKLNLTYLKQYSDTYTHQVVGRFFQNKAQATGQELLQLTPHRQVNLFVLKDIFERWKKEIEKLKSPYFDYQALEVKQAIQETMNVLSRHISVKADYLEPLMIEAVQDMVSLYMEPRVYFERYFNTVEHTKVSLKTLKEIKKYFVYHSNLVDQLISQMEDSGKSELSSDQVLKQIAQFDFDQLDYHKLADELAKVIPIDLGALGVKESEEGEQASASESTSFFDTVEDSQQETIERAEVKTEAKQTEEVVSNAPEKEVPSQSQKKAGVLDAKYFQQFFASDATRFGQTKLDKITGNINLNQRFMFINALFKNNEEAFKSAIKGLDEANSFDQAISILNAEYANTWDPDSEEVEELLALVYRRFRA